MRFSFFSLSRLERKKKREKRAVGGRKKVSECALGGRFQKRGRERLVGLRSSDALNYFTRGSLERPGRGRERKIQGKRARRCLGDDARRGAENVGGPTLMPAGADVEWRRRRRKEKNELFLFLSLFGYSHAREARDTRGSLDLSRSSPEKKGQRRAVAALWYE